MKCFKGLCSQEDYQSIGAGYTWLMGILNFLANYVAWRVSRTVTNMDVAED